MSLRSGVTVYESSSKHSLAVRGMSPTLTFEDGSDECEDLSFLSTPEWNLTRRVADSKLLSKSTLLPKFLLHICELALRGRAHEITEQRIGTAIFNRHPDYNPGEDNIVRSYARMLRKRLDHYFEDEGRDEAMRIVIPRGGYVPVFVDVEPTVSELKESTTNSEEPAGLDTAETPLLESASLLNDSLPTPKAASVVAPAAASRWMLLGMTLMACLLLVALLAVGLLLRERGTVLATKPSAAHALWTQMFQSGYNTVIVPADSGLGIVENLSGHQVTLEEYANGSFLTELKPPPGLNLGNFNDLRRQRYTSVSDLSITARLTGLPEYLPARTQIRFARSLSAEDLKGTNVILLGSKHTNPWDELFERRLNFHLEYSPTVDESWVANEHPLQSELKVYRNGVDSAANRTYGTASYLPALDGNGQVLLIQGLNMAGTQAAAEILFNAQSIGPVLREAALPGGRLRPFELLVETSSIGATAPETQIIAKRFY